MADEKENVGAAPAGFDPAAFMNDLEGRIGNLIEEKIPKPAVSNPYGSVRPAAPKQDDSDPMSNLVDPYVQRAVKPLQEQVLQANLRAQSAEDRAAFYAKHRDLAPEVADKVEKAFNRLAEAGSPFVREDILAWEMGKNFDKYRTEADEREKAERDRVAAAATVGSHGVPHAAMGDRDFNSMSDDELALATKGKVF